MQKISFVIPCYRSEHTLAAVHEELTATMQTLPQYDYEVVLINDCSPDDTIGTIRQTPMCRAWIWRKTSASTPR